MTRFLRHLLRGLLALFLYWCGAMFLVIGARLSSGSMFKAYPVLTGLVAFVAGIFLFRRFLLQPVYIFRHEMTHYLVAKLFLRDTGKIRLGGTRGSVEIPQPNSWIVLGPYFIPLYALVATLLFWIVGLFWHSMPLWAACVFGGAIGLCWAYHFALTWTALRKGQEDIGIYGPFFSYGMIVAGKAFCLMAGILTLTSSWGKGYGMFVDMARVQYVLIQETLHAFGL